LRHFALGRPDQRSYLDYRTNAALAVGMLLARADEVIE
jgi:hypothetical protein